MASYDYSSGGFPSSPSTNDTLTMHGTSYTYDGAAWKVTGATAQEGTAILSTGETGGTKYLREDGDGTSSWQAVAGGGSMELLSSQTITGTSTSTVEFTSIPSGYSRYTFIIKTESVLSSGFYHIYNMYFGTSSGYTTSNYMYSKEDVTTTTTGRPYIDGSAGTACSHCDYQWDIVGLTDAVTTTYKMWGVLSTPTGSGSGSPTVWSTIGYQQSETAFTQVKFAAVYGQALVGTIYLYGLKKT